MTILQVADAAASSASGKVPTRALRPFPMARASATQIPWLQLKPVQDMKRCAASLALSAGLFCAQALAPSPPAAAKVDIVQLPLPQPQTTAHSPSSTTARPLSPTLIAHMPTVATAPVLLTLPLPIPSPLPLAPAVSGVAAVAEEAEVLVEDVVHFFQHSVEAVEHTVHHLQVVHALERLEGMPLNQVVDLELLKAAIHPVGASYDIAYDTADEQSGVAPAVRRLDAALDAVAGWRLRDVVDTDKLAAALQDVPYSGPLESSALQQEAPRIRRAVHWDAMTECVRPQALRRALAALGAQNGGPFSELDMRAAVTAVRMDNVRKVLSPPKLAPHQPDHTLDVSGMWTWESM